jgi:hypothetical protein
MLTTRIVIEMPKISRITGEQAAAAKASAPRTPPDDLGPGIKALVNDVEHARRAFDHESGTG